MRAPTLRILALTSMLFAAGCAASGDARTVSGARTVFSDPVTVDIADARFNVPSLSPAVDAVRRTMRDNGAVVTETYYIGAAPIVVVEHASEAWFSDLSLANARDEVVFREFLLGTAMANTRAEISPLPASQGRGFIARSGDCVAFRFFKRLKGNTGYANDVQNPDTFIVGFTCGDESATFVQRFGLMSPAEATRIDRRHSI